MRLDLTKILLGAGVLGGAALLYFSKPAKERAGVGDRVLVGMNEAGVQSAVKIRITAATTTNITGVPYEAVSGIPAPPITVPRDNIISFAS